MKHITIYANHVTQDRIDDFIQKIKANAPFEVDIQCSDYIFDFVGADYIFVMVSNELLDDEFIANIKRLSEMKSGVSVVTPEDIPMKAYLALQDANVPLIELAKNEQSQNEMIKKHLEYKKECRGRIKLKEGGVYIDGQFILLNHQEQTLLALLLEHQNEIVSYDTIGETLWKSEIYDTYRVNNIIHTTRKKHPLLKTSIKNIAKRGYIFDY